MLVPSSGRPKALVNTRSCSSHSGPAHRRSPCATGYPISHGNWTTFAGSSQVLQDASSPTSAPILFTAFAL